MVNHRIASGILSYSSDRTYSYKRTDVVVRTNTFIYLYHICLIKL